MRVNAGGLGTYYNPLVDKREHLVEPWSGLVECHSERGDATTQLRVEVQSWLRHKRHKRVPYKRVEIGCHVPGPL